MPSSPKKRFSSCLPTGGVGRVATDVRHPGKLGEPETKITQDGVLHEKRNARRGSDVVGRKRADAGAGPNGGSRAGRLWLGTGWLRNVFAAGKRAARPEFRWTSRRPL